MDIFAELEKLRMDHVKISWGCSKHPRNDLYENELCECNCGADKHNETLDGIIEYLERCYISDNGIDLY